jgi:hypothetical protein
VRKADPTTFMYRLSKNLEASTSWKPKGLSRPVMGLLSLFALLHYTLSMWELGFFTQETIQAVVFGVTRCHNPDHSMYTFPVHGEGELFT